MTRVILDKIVNEYIRQCVQTGSTLAKKSQSINLDNGLAFAYLPKRQNVRVNDFHTGGLLDAAEAREAEEKVVQEIVDYLNDQADRCVVLDDLIHHPGEMPIASLFYFVHDKQVFLYADKQISSSASEIKSAIRKASFRPFIALLTHWEQKPAMSTGVEITMTEAAQLVANIEAIIVNAWDDEGFIVWAANGSSVRV
jgi:hypothetical protein